MTGRLLTLFPTTSVCPSGAHASVNASPRPVTSLKHALVRTSQNLTTPSLLTLHSSASLVGLKATFSIGAAWPLSSVENLTCAFSGFPTPSKAHHQHTVHCPHLTRESLKQPFSPRLPPSRRNRGKLIALISLTHRLGASCCSTPSRPTSPVDSTQCSEGYYIPFLSAFHPFPRTQNSRFTTRRTWSPALGMCWGRNRAGCAGRQSTSGNAPWTGSAAAAVRAP